MRTDRQTDVQSVAAASNRRGDEESERERKMEESQETGDAAWSGTELLCHCLIELKSCLVFLLCLPLEISNLLLLVSELTSFAIYTQIFPYYVFLNLNR